MSAIFPYFIKAFEKAHSILEDKLRLLSIIIEEVIFLFSIKSLSISLLIRDKSFGKNDKNSCNT